MHRLSQQLSAFAQSMHDAEAAQSLFGEHAAGASVYANNVLHNRADALTEAFPVVRQLVGEEFFGAMARAAARVQPSYSSDLNRYGAEFAQFIAQFPPAQALPYLADAAKLDWLCHRAYYAEEAEPFDVAALTTMSADEHASLRFTLQPSVALLSSRWPIASLWRAHQPRESEDWEDFPSPDQGGETALVWRTPRHRVKVVRLLPASAAFLQACAQALPFSEALERALDADMEFELEASLSGWISDQVITNHFNGD